MRAAIEVLADPLLERGRRVQRDDLAVVDDGDAIAVLRLVHVVRGQEQRRAVLLAAAPRSTSQVRARVCGSSPVVGSSRNRISGRWIRPARDLQPALHAAREGARQILAPVVEVDELQRLVDARARARARGTR